MKICENATNLPHLKCVNNEYRTLLRYPNIYDEWMVRQFPVSEHFVLVPLWDETFDMEEHVEAGRISFVLIGRQIAAGQ